jgi:hypothetical protein
LMTRLIGAIIGASTALVVLVLVGCGTMPGRPRGGGKSRSSMPAE